MVRTAKLDPVTEKTAINSSSGSLIMSMYINVLCSLIRPAFLPGRLPFQKAMAWPLRR